MVRRSSMLEDQRDCSRSDVLLTPSLESTGSHDSIQRVVDEYTPKFASRGIPLVHLQHVQPVVQSSQALRDLDFLRASLRSFEEGGGPISSGPISAGPVSFYGPRRLHRPPSAVFGPHRAGPSFLRPPPPASSGSSGSAAAPLFTSPRLERALNAAFSSSGSCRCCALCTAF